MVEDHILVFSGEAIVKCARQDSFVISCQNSDLENLLDRQNWVFIEEQAGKKIYGTYSTQIFPGGDFSLIPIRDALALSEKKVFDLICRTRHLLHWHQNSLYSGCCGATTIFSSDETAKICSSCKKISYPYFSNFVLVLIEKEGQLLLARSPGFAEGVYSVVAGFVNPGESYEDAVSREVYEELGIAVKDIIYFGSQPWPFPSSMAVAFTAVYAEGEILKDSKEIEDARWFMLDKLPLLPHPCSLSRQIIDSYIQTKTQS